MSLGLIVAIGAQNAFVLRREHVGSVVLFCAEADAALIAAGVLGMAQALGQSPNLARALALVGAIFVAVYGWQTLRRAWQAHQLKAVEGGAGLGRGAAVAQAAAFMLLNPHVYLDTVLLVGSISEPASSNRHSRRAFDDRRRVRRGFLPGGLSNTCPQTSVMRGPVVCDGQVSDKPKLRRTF